MHHSDLTLHHIMLYIFAASSLSRKWRSDGMASPVGRVPLKRSCCGAAPLIAVILLKERGAMIGKFKWLYIGIWLIGKSQPKEAMSRQLLTYARATQ